MQNMRNLQDYWMFGALFSCCAVSCFGLNKRNRLYKCYYYVGVKWSCERFIKAETKPSLSSAFQLIYLWPIFQSHFSKLIKPQPMTSIFND